MTDTTKAFLKNTILGLLGGGAASALYAMHSSKKDSTPDPDFKKDEIVVPLSRRNFLKAVRPERFGGAALPVDTAEEPQVSDADVGKMSPKDLAALKKALLRKKAECSGSCGGKCSKLKKLVTPSSATSPVRHVVGAGSTFSRDKKGRFKADAASTKTAGVMSDAGEVMLNNAGLLGGLATGMVAVKMVSDRILVNKKKRQVEEARKRYVDALSREVNDEDTPYYSKSADDHGLFGTTLGWAGLAGLAASTTAGIVMYRIMENRRKEIEKAKDKDLAKYPLDKSIKFGFPRTEDDGFFG